MSNIQVVFRDMAELEKEERGRLKARQFLLDQIKARNNDKLPEELQDEYDQIENKLESSAVVDPVFKAVQQEFPGVKDHAEGLLPSQVSGVALTAAEILLAAALGILQRDNQANTGQTTIITGKTVGLQVINAAMAKRFATALALARGEYTANKALFDAVLPILVEEGLAGLLTSGGSIAVATSVTRPAVVRADQWAAVVKILVGQGIEATDIHLDLKTKLALASQEGANENASPSSISIDLPDLEEQSDVEIVADNLRAMQALYFAAMLEEMKVFQVVDKLVELFQYGMLPLGKGTAGDMLYGYWKKSVNRLTEIERRNLYARAFGLPGGEAGGTPNREFDELFLRFVSGVSSFVRQFTVDELLRAKVALTVNTQQVQKAARDLAANLSLHGYGVAYFAATELQSQIKDAISVLGNQEIKGAYGARDMFQVIDQVATLELGGARNSIRCRTMANAGAVIIGWLAARSSLLASPGRVRILDLDVIRDENPRPLGVKATVDPTDRDLVDACEQWLAVTGTSGDRVQEYSQPSEAPMVTSSPIRIPEVARELLETVGIKPNGKGAVL
jgi:hypothetical protein